MSYEAIIAPLENGMKHPNADRLKVFNVCGKNVVVGLDHEDGELGVFFGDDGKLTDEFCKANDLYPRFVEGVRVGGGFFDERKPRVRAQNFRGVKSEGFWMPLDCLTFTGLSIEKLRDTMPVGTTFDTVNKVLICEKYYTPATLKQLKNAGKVQRKILGFPKHIDTRQFAYESFKIELGARIYITEKLHGTSGRTAKALVTQDKPRTLLQKLLRQPAVEFSEWEYLTGTRNVVLKGESAVGQGFYGDDTFRSEISKTFQTLLHKNEVVYYEIVGYAAGVPIMPSHAIPKDLKDLKKQYGPEMGYRYGCVEGQNKIYVYRIAFANEDGHTVDLPWEKVKLRCHELGLQHVPEIDGFDTFDVVTKEKDRAIVTNGDVLDPLDFLVDKFMVGSSTLDHTHIREGVVLRVENPSGSTLYLKAKSYEFRVLEGIIKSNDDYVDLEETS